MSPHNVSHPRMAHAETGAALTDWQRLGDGGQGEVWRVTMLGKAFAAKIYFPHTATAQQRKAIERLVASPVRSPHFLWPEAIVDCEEGSGRFGYLMPLRQPHFRSFNEVVGGSAALTFDAALTAALNLADAFLELHASGLAYRDISLGNVFVDPNSGAIAICDTDNVGVDGKDLGGVLGTSGFMAPEIERGEAIPSAATDRHSLAVLLFLLFVRHHPLEGRAAHQIRCLDAPARLKLYGREPVYIFDPTNTSNRPVPREQPNPGVFGPIYPSNLWDTFKRAFTEGLHRPSARVTESVWKRTIIATRDLLVTCACGAQRFVEPGPQRPCWHCGRRPAQPLFLDLDGGPRGRVRIAVGANKTVTAAQVGAVDSDHPIAIFVPNPTDPSVIGLRNCGRTRWTRTNLATRSIQSVEPG